MASRVLYASVMYDLAFRLKRAHLQNLVLCRSLTATFRLTPARFDILFAIFTSNGSSTTRQHNLLRLLGLAGSTLSEMLARLEQLSLIRREPDPSDRRHRLVTLTEEGSRRITEASYDLLVGGSECHEISDAYTNALARHIPLQRDGRLVIPSPRDVLFASLKSIGQLLELAQRFARGLGDCAALLFPDGDD